jgi:hypothetical protein
MTTEDVVGVAVTVSAAVAYTGMSAVNNVSMRSADKILVNRFIMVFPPDKIFGWGVSMMKIIPPVEWRVKSK